MTNTTIILTMKISMTMSAAVIMIIMMTMIQLPTVEGFTSTSTLPLSSSRYSSFRVSNPLADGKANENGHSISTRIRDTGAGYYSNSQRFDDKLCDHGNDVDFDVHDHVHVGDPLEGSEREEWKLKGGHEIPSVVEHTSLLSDIPPVRTNEDPSTDHTRTHIDTHNPDSKAGNSSHNQSSSSSSRPTILVGLTSIMGTSKVNLGNSIGSCTSWASNQNQNHGDVGKTASSRHRRTGASASASLSIHRGILADRYVHARTHARNHILSKSILFASSSDDDNQDQYQDNANEENSNDEAMDKNAKGENENNDNDNEEGNDNNDNNNDSVAKDELEISVQKVNADDSETNHDKNLNEMSSAEQERSVSTTTSASISTSTSTSTSITSTRKRTKHIIAPIRKAIKKFKSKPTTYLLIPVIAAIVGWFTNWLAVQMIFYPVKFRGIPIYRKVEVPLGLIGWQGIVPCKTRTMSEAMVTMVTTQLLSVQEVFQRLDPNKIAGLLAPEVPKLGKGIIKDILPNQASLGWMSNVPEAIFVGLPEASKEIIQKMNHNFLRDFTVAMQDNISSLLNVRNCVVDQMVMDRTMLGALFQKCGKKELEFLTNSGLWFGFFLGVIQMLVALFWDNPWSLSIGGGIVGLATNWLALKFIFEPVNPTKVGPFVLQGLFLTRQKEVAKEFSQFFADRILTSKQLFHSILTDPETSPRFQALFMGHFTAFAKAISSGLGVLPEPEVLAMAAKRAVEKLPNHIGVVHNYVDENLRLQETLRISMEGMTSEQFERVLHPIFEEDELTLILAGAVLGFAAGLVQQGLETGKIQIQIPSVKDVWAWMKGLPKQLREFSPGTFVRTSISRSLSPIARIMAKIIRKLRSILQKGSGSENGMDDKEIESPGRE